MAMSSKNLKKIFYVFGVLCLLGGIAKGIEVFRSESYLLDDDMKTTSLITWIITGILVMAVLVGFGNLLADIEKIAEAADRYIYFSQKGASVNGNASIIKQNNPPVPASVGEIWTCPECGERNPRSNRVCKSCGHQR